MSRRGRPDRRQQPARPLLQSRRVEVGPDGYDYQVVQLPGAKALKIYRCPGCDHEIRVGTAHVVVWPADLGENAVDDRRHWHTPCWTNRANRSPTRRWS